MKELNFRRSAPLCAQVDGPGAERKECGSLQPKRMLAYAAAVALVAEGLCSSCGSPSRQPDGELDADVAEADIESDAHPEAGPDADMDADTDADSDSDTGLDADDEADAEIDGDESIDADTETDAGTDADIDVEPDADIRADADADADIDVEPDAEADSGPDSGTDADIDADPDSDETPEADVAPDADYEADAGGPVCELSSTGGFVDVILYGAGYLGAVGDSGSEILEEAYSLTANVTMSFVCTSTGEVILESTTFDIGACEEVTLVDGHGYSVGIAAVDVAYVGDDGQLLAVNIVGM